MGKKLTDKEIDAIQNGGTKMLDVCLVCEGMEKEGSMQGVDPTGMSWDVVCDECTEGGYLNSRYVFTYITLNKISVGGHSIYDDHMLGTIYFSGVELDYSVFATPNWECREGIVPIEMVTTNGDCITLGELHMNGNLSTQMETYIKGVEGFMAVAEIIAESLVVSN